MTFSGPMAASLLLGAGGDKTGLYIIGGAVALFVLAIAAYYLARFMKGRVVLELSRNTANSGETLPGVVSLEAKKQTHGLLKVSLVGRMQQRQNRTGSGNTSTQWVEVYRFDKVLEEERDFPAGFGEVYSFELTAPSATEARRAGAAIRAVGDKVGGVTGTLMKAAAGVADLTQGRITWHVEARLDAQGVDLYTKRKVTVNLRD